MLLLLKNEKPTNELVRLLLSRETKHRGDPFVTSALRFFFCNFLKNAKIFKKPFLFLTRYWCQDFEETLSEIIAGLLTSKYPNSSPNKRKRPLKGSSNQNISPSADQVNYFLLKEIHRILSIFSFL